MSRHIYARMPSQAGAAFEYAIKRGDDWQIAQQDRFKLVGDDHVTVLVPGTEIAIHRVLMPARSEKEAYRAAPFAIEDELAEPVETVHVAIGKPEKVGEQTYRDIHVCSRARMDEWVEQIKTAGLKRAMLVAEQSVLLDAQYGCSGRGPHLVCA